MIHTRYSTACGCSVLDRVKEYKYLGIIIDYRLCWYPHVQYVKKNLRKFIYAFNQLSEVLSVDQRRTVYFAYVQSVLLYGIIGWSGAASGTFEPLEVTQRTIIRTVLKRNYKYPSSQLYLEFPVLKVRQLFIKTLLIFIRNNKTVMLTDTQHLYLTRHRTHYGFNTVRLTISLELTNSYYLAQIIYRNLPQHIKLAEGDSDAVYKLKVGRWLYRIGSVKEARILLCGI